MRQNRRLHMVCSVRSFYSVLGEELEIGFNTFLLYYRHDWGVPPSEKNGFVTPLKNRGPCPTMLKTFDK